ncbi:MAG: hypothetical protein ACPHL9_10655, partial [Limisphaerales bacterium]
FQKIFEHKDDEEIDVRMKSKLATKKPKGDPEKVVGNDDDVGEENSGKITGIHRAVEIEWEGTDGAEFALQRSNDLGNGETTSVFLRVSGHTQFWRLQPE